MSVFVNDGRFITTQYMRVAVNRDLGSKRLQMLSYLLGFDHLVHPVQLATKSVRMTIVRNEYEEPVVITIDLKDAAVDLYAYEAGLRYIARAIMLGALSQEVDPFFADLPVEDDKTSYYSVTFLY